MSDHAHRMRCTVQEMMEAAAPLALRSPVNIRVMQARLCAARLCEALSRPASAPRCTVELSDLTCSINMAVCAFPVLTEAGSLYEKSAILRWWAAQRENGNRFTDPSTGVVVQPSFIPCRFRQGLVEQLVNSGMATPPEWVEILFASALSGDVAPLTRLVSKLKVSVDVVDADGNTALHLAAMRMDRDTYKALLELGAYDGAMNVLRKTPKDILSSYVQDTQHEIANDIAAAEQEMAAAQARILRAKHESALLSQQWSRFVV